MRLNRTHSNRIVIILLIYTCREYDFKIFNSFMKMDNLSVCVICGKKREKLISTNWGCHQKKCHNKKNHLIDLNVKFF